MASNVDKSKINAVVDGSGPNGKLKEGDDFPEETKKTIGEYINCLTEEGGNRFVLSPGSKKSNTQTIDPSAPGAEESFAPNDPELARHSDSGLIFSPSINDFIEKGKDGHDVLKDIDGVTKTGGANTSSKIPNNKVQRAISNVLLNNRFNSSERSPFVHEGDVPQAVAGEQKQLGVYDPSGKDITFEQLSKISKSMALKAVGNIFNGDPDDLAAGAVSAIPGTAQLGATKINSQDMYAKNAFGAPDKLELEGTLREGKGMGSWGQLNNPTEPFNGFAPISMLALSGILIVSLRVVASALVSLLSLVVKPNSDKNSIPPRGPFALGQFGRPDPGGPISLRDIGIRPTERDFLTSVDKGIDIFLRFDFQSPGYYVNMIRSIVRSGNVIVNDIKDAFSPGRNLLATAQSVVGVVDVIKDSKIVAFLNVMAQIGDKALEIESQGFSSGDKEISTVDRLVDNAATRVMKSRRGDTKLAWRNSATPSKYLFPSSIQTLDNMLNGQGTTKVIGAIAGLNGQVANSDEISNNRITPEVVRRLEDDLEAEYVPFYFHDLRTNEIISFPAFLTALDDNFTANYNSTEPYGRVDPVRIYKNTTRTLTIGFKVAATNKEDFDEMWWKLNKLTTYMYPQWSQGKQVRSREFSDDRSFIQPFSQIPKASPLIRVRIGDVIKSNYSKFNLSRIFGFGTDKNNIIEVTEELKDLQDLKKRVEDEKRRMSADPSNIPANHVGKAGYVSGDVAMLLPKLHGGYVEATSASRRAGIAARGIVARVSRGRLGNLESRRLRTSSSTRVQVIKGPAEDKGFLSQHGGKPVTFYTVSVVNPSGEEQEGDWLVTHQDLYPDLRSLAINARGGFVGVNDEIDMLDDRFEIISKFMSADAEGGNSIVKAFESTRGRGLAGFITSLSFPEMSANIWETTEHGSRAPKVLQINLTFEAIHDIAPGLDNEGFNRAPVYSAGQISKLVAGDPYDGDGSENFEKDHGLASKSIGNKS